MDYVQIVIVILQLNAVEYLFFFYRKYPEGWTTDPGRDSQLEYRLSIYHASRDDSGVFTCVTPTRHTHAVEILVKGAIQCFSVVLKKGFCIATF
jgi:hypothetical protein